MTILRSIPLRKRQQSPTRLEFSTYSAPRTKLLDFPAEMITSRVVALRSFYYTTIFLCIFVVIVTQFLLSIFQVIVRLRANKHLSSLGEFMTDWRKGKFTREHTSKRDNNNNNNTALFTLTTNRHIYMASDKLAVDNFHFSIRVSSLTFS